MAKDKIQKQRIVIWTKEDRRGNETAFASIDLRAPWTGDGTGRRTGHLSPGVAGSSPAPSTEGSLHKREGEG